MDFFCFTEARTGGLQEVLARRCVDCTAVETHDIIDPQNATTARLNRTAFVGLSAAAAVGAASGPALAQATQALGKTHPPLVPEDDPDLTIQRVSIARPDGTIAAYAASPKNATSATPGVVVVMHIWGVDTSIRDVVRRLAKEGYVAIAPDLYGRFGAPNGDGATDAVQFRDYANKLIDAQADGDIRAAAEWIRATHPNARLGVTGFCMGGSIALRQAVDNADTFAAAAVWYGKVRYATGGPPGSNQGSITEMALGYTDEIRIPILGSFGERDTSILPEDVRAFQKRLRVANDIKIYPEAGHAFFDDQRESYVPSAAADAWSRALAFFAKYLKL